MRVAIGKGTTTLGSMFGHDPDPARDRYPEERPIVRARVLAFWLEHAPVTVAEFAAFVDDTGHTTTAERLGWSIAFVRPKIRISRPGHWWREVTGLSWRHAYDHGLLDHPVTHVSVLDAEAYCAWVGGRLPTEAEWVHAAQLGGHTEDKPADGTANIWLGDFPLDREWFGSPALTTPVGTFGPDALGLVDMRGNVWQMTSSRWAAKHVKPCCSPTVVDGDERRIKKGGSFACHDSAIGCRRYRPAARQPVDLDTNTTAHTGFRVAYDGEG